MEEKGLVAVHEQRLKALEARMKGLEHQSEAIHELAMSVKELTINQTQMLKELQEQGGRIKALEEEPIARSKHIREKVVDSIVGAVVGALMGILLGIFLRG